MYVKGRSSDTVYRKQITKRFHKGRSSDTVCKCFGINKVTELRPSKTTLFIPFYKRCKNHVNEFFGQSTEGVISRVIITFIKIINV